MQVNSPDSQVDTPLLVNLPDLPVPKQICPRRTCIQIDFILLALEALDLNASETMMASIQALNLAAVVPNRVALWRLRNTNPLRRFSKRLPLTLVQAKALVAIACFLARRQTAQIRQLLNAQEQLKAQNLAPEQYAPLAQYLERFRGHFRSRMNPNRTAIAAYKDPQALNELALHLLGQALFCTGTAGMERFWSSLFDGEVT